MNNKEKQQFRRSTVWSRFRQKLRLMFDKKDYLTNEPLLRDWNLHHLDMNDKHYTDLSNTGKFIPVNRETHKFIHWLFRYYRHDKDVMRRLKFIMDMMLLYNPPRKRHVVREND